MCCVLCGSVGRNRERIGSFRKGEGLQPRLCILPSLCLIILQNSTNHRDTGKLTRRHCLDEPESLISIHIFASRHTYSVLLPFDQGRLALCVALSSLGDGNWKHAGMHTATRIFLSPCTQHSVHVPHPYLAQVNVLL